MDLYWYWLANLEGIGPITTNKLLQYFGSPKEIYEKMGFETVDRLYEYMCTDFCKITTLMSED